MIQFCRHILRNNRQCGQPAVNSTLFCRHHRDAKGWMRSSGLRSQIRPQIETYDHGTILVADPGAQQPALSLSKGPDSRTRENQTHPPVDLEFPEDPAAILTNIYRITTLLVQGQIDRPTANSVTYGMQVCLSALGGKSLFDPASQTRSQAHSQARSRNDSGDGHSETTYSDRSAPSTAVSRPIHRVILTPEGDEIAPPAEILEDNEAEPIHHRLCPCLLCAEKYRNQPPEEHHPDCQCGLCEEPNTEHSTQSTESTGTNVGSEDAEPCALSSVPCHIVPCRIARASALLSGSTNRDPLNRPWSVAEYTFGDAIRRHEAQYAARAAAALAVGIEPPPYQPYKTGLISPGTPEHAEDQQMQQFSDEYWSAHFRAQIADRPDIQQYLDEEQQASESGSATGD